MTRGLDSFFLAHGKKVENRRREQGVYPTKEIYTPSEYDRLVSAQEYHEDVRIRYGKGQLKAGESYNPKTGEVGLSGQAAVMGSMDSWPESFLMKIRITNSSSKNPSRWIDVLYLTPYGIMKINREPVAKFTPDIIARDHEFWGKYMERLIGNWITYETSTDDICNFAYEVYLRGNFRGYIGDMKFLRDDNAQKAFSKLRSAITGLYWWRASSTTSAEEQQMLLREAEFSAKQAYALCPFSPEALYKLVNMLVIQGRFDESINLIMTSMLFDPENDGLKDLLAQVEVLKAKSLAEGTEIKTQQLEQAYLVDTNNYSNAINLAAHYLETKRSSDAQAFCSLPPVKKLNDETDDPRR